jgi:plastocyanin
LLAVVAIVAFAPFGSPNGGNRALARQGAGARATGRIEGVATISNQITTPRLRVRVYDEPGTPPPKVTTDTNPFGNVVLWLEATGNPAALRGIGGLAHPAAELHQHDQAFSPHVLVVVAGTTVDFPNDDAIYHNVFSLSGVKQFDLGRYTQGTHKYVTFPTPGIVQVFCHIHADMNAHIIVLDNPFFVVPDKTGRFALDGVPPGDYQLVAWHERIKQLKIKVHVDSGLTTSIKLNIPLPDRPRKP